ncbi:rare lipoprotein A [Rhodospirillum rubrum F11]|nr:rare lipoprotein A [Rhodospirillum rubrum F11]
MRFHATAAIAPRSMTKIPAARSRRLPWPAFLAITLTALTAACAQTAPVVAPAPAPMVEVIPAKPAVDRIYVSWYGRSHQGKRTASGEIFDANGMTAAHPKLPFGSKVKMRNPESGQSVVVRVNDRGPFVSTRGMDVSEAAAKALGIWAKGIALVEVESPLLGRPITPGRFTVDSLASSR